MEAGALAALLLAELHHLADVLIRRQDRGPDHRFTNLFDPAWVGHRRRVVNLDRLAARHRHLEADRRHRRHQVEVVLALQPLTNDVHMQQAEEAAAKTEAEGVGGLRLPS